MTAFDTIAVVDWSGGKETGRKPRKDAIWAAVARDAVVEEPEYLRNRPAAEAWLVALCETELTAGRRVLIGFDFPFGYPDGFATQVAGLPNPLALWDRLAEGLERVDGDRFALAGELNALFPGVGPFWFNSIPARPVEGLPPKGSDRTDTGLPEKRRVEVLAKGAFTCWQMGGAGAVGSQAMTGTASLSRLRARFGDRVRVWPFEPLDAPVALVEVWPSLIDEVVRTETGESDIRDAVQVRVLARAIANMQTGGSLEAALAAVPPEARREEGWILGVGAESALRAAAAPLARDDCLALPRGIEWTPVDVALDRLREALACVAAVEEVALADAAGRILAEDTVALRSNPPAANAAVDGYAIRRSAVSDGPVTLPLAEGRAAAGRPFAGAVPEGHALRILTGALLPTGADTVILQEDATVAEGRIHLRRAPKEGANIRRAGEDVAAGNVMLPPGRVVGAPDLALLSAVGVGRVVVRRRLRVGVLSTGDEICEPGEPAPPERIYDANRPMLLSVLERWGHAANDLGCVADDRNVLRARLDQAVGKVDAILTSGGASGGDEDHVSALLSEAGTVSTWRIAVKPGRPLMLGGWQGVPVFGLPGNPVAALITTLVFARPALSLLAGAGWVEPSGFEVPAAFEKRKKAGRREYLRGRMTGDGRVEVFGSEGSGRISGLSWAGGLVELPDGALHIRPGDLVRFQPWSGFGL